MLQTQVSPPTVSDPRAPAPPALVTDLVDGDHFDRLVERQALRCRRLRQPLSALSLQVRFDADSHAALGPQLLAECARRLCSRVRSTDSVVRWQLTHFGVLLPRCEPVHAEAVLARLIGVASGNYRLGDVLLQLQVKGRVLEPLWA